MNKTIQGAYLIDANAAVLNNLGADDTISHENAVAVKKIKREGRNYALVSGQALRNWLRTTLGKDFKWELSPIIREKKIAFTFADPVKYPDDDIFGYMKAGKGETLTRLSPFKNSCLVSSSPVQFLNNFGVMGRHEGDPVPYANQIYSTILKGIFSIDVESSGTFYKVNRTGFLNINDKYVTDNKANLEESDDPFFFNKEKKPHKRYRLKSDERRKRVEDVLTAFNKLNGGASQTAHLTDVAPKFMILTILEGGNHIFSHVVHEKEGKTVFSADALNEVINDYEKEIQGNVYIGYREGFMDEWKKELGELKENKKIIIDTPVEAVKKLIASPEFKGLF